MQSSTYQFGAYERQTVTYMLKEHVRDYTGTPNISILEKHIQSKIKIILWSKSVLGSSSDMILYPQDSGVIMIVFNDSTSSTITLNSYLI